MFPCYCFNSIPLETSTGYVLVCNDACGTGVLTSDLRFQHKSAILKAEWSKVDRAAKEKKEKLPLSLPLLQM